MRRATLFTCWLALAALAPTARASSISSDLLIWLDERYMLEEPVAIIAQLNQPLTSHDREYLLADSEHLLELDNLRMLAVTVPARALPRWAAHSKISALSLDRRVVANGCQAAVSASDPPYSLLQEGSGAAALDRTSLGSFVDGSGVNVAVIDSGASKASDSSIHYKTSMIPSIPDDAYGHGSHVAGIINGNGALSSGSGNNYAGVARGSKIISVRVLDDNGQGTISQLLSGIEWVLTNRTKYSIRVVNMSLGAPAVESYKTDPLCQATKRLYDAGVIVVASAGNGGKSADGSKLFGTISSPGNSPWVITVGASDDKGTIKRSDDGVADYSSRGPTRSYNAATGIYDHLVKPDLVAPGTRVVAASGAKPTMCVNYPVTCVADANNKFTYLKLSGTSMAAAVVSGILADMIEANPALTPGMAKGILLYTAQTMPSVSVYEQGAGLLNAEGAVRLAYALRSAPLNPAPGTVLLKASLMPAPYSTIGGERIDWSRGYIKVQKSGQSGLVNAGGIIFAEGILFAENVVAAKGILFAEGTLFAEGILFAENSALRAQGILFAETAPALTATGALNASTVSLVSGASLGNGRLTNALGIVFAEGVLFAEGILFAEATAGAPVSVKFAGQTALAAQTVFASGTLLDNNGIATFYAQSSGPLGASDPTLR